MAPDLAGGGYPDPREDATPIAWRCEQCRKLQPTNVPSHVIHIDEIRTDWYGEAVKRHARFIRRMVVCPPCRRSIAGM